jgi:hypothetical protein
MASGYNTLNSTYKGKAEKKSVVPKTSKNKLGKGNKKPLESPADGPACDHRSNYAK